MKIPLTKRVLKILQSEHPVQRTLQILRTKIFYKYWNNWLLQQMPKESICAEIGVYEGKFSMRIMKEVRPVKLHLIDPWKYESNPLYQDALYGGHIGSQGTMEEKYRLVQKIFANEIESDVVVLHRTSADAALKNFEDEYFDWVYIDGNHQYEYVKRDLENAYRKVKRGGYITGDDYRSGEWWGDGVIRAVHEFNTTGRCEPVQIKGCKFIFRKP